MITFKTNSENIIRIPAFGAPLSRYSSPFHIGIDFSHFYNIYLSPIYNTSKFLEEIISTMTTIINNLRSFNIEPIFAFSGISFTQIDCSHSYLEREIENFLRTIDVRCFHSPSTNNAQLSTLLRLKCINAIMSSPTIVLRDISRWIHFIDFKKNQIILLRGDLSIMKELLSSRSLSEIPAPSFNYNQLIWNAKPPISNPSFIQVPDIVLTLLEKGIIQSPRLASYALHTGKRPLFPIPRNCVDHLNILCGIYYTLFLHLSKLSFSKITPNSDSPQYDEFLPLLLAQNSISESCTLNETLISQILAQQNITSTRFTTLFECLKAVSPPHQATSPDEMTPEYVISESVRRFLTAHEYIAPGGGLSPWGRAILVANTGFDMATLLFIELVRADIIDSDFYSLFGGVGVIDMIERTFSLFPTITKVPDEMLPDISENDNHSYRHKRSASFSQRGPSTIIDMDNSNQPNESPQKSHFLSTSELSSPKNQYNSRYPNSKVAVAKSEKFDHYAVASTALHDSHLNPNSDQNPTSNGINSKQINEQNRIYYRNHRHGTTHTNNHFRSNDSSIKNELQLLEMNRTLHSNSGYFKPTLHIFSDTILSLLRLIVCDTYMSAAKQPSLNELISILNQLPFHEFHDNSTGILMRFLLESSDEKRMAFIESVPRKQLRKDINKAFSWWKSLNRATTELKQRSLKPNSRVSNLKNFLVMFECANQFVEKTIDHVLTLI